jgi:peptidoglycan/LPS O-acetylase OafA/YrhL
MWVVFYHFWDNLGVSAPDVVAKGYLGVELFFVLSGFILSHVYMEAFGERRFRYPDFLRARLARIYPVHLATLLGLALIVVLAGALGANVGDRVIAMASLPAQLTLTQAWGLGLAGGWNHPSWSISAEWFAYLTFPGFAFLIWPLRRRPWVAALLAAGLVIGLNVGFRALAGFPLTQATIAWGALRIVPCFALGCAVWLLWRVETIRSAWLAKAGVAASIAAVVVSALAGAPDFVFICLFGVLILALGSLPGAGSMLTAPIWVYLGEVSFAVYMVCIPWQLVFEHGAKTLLHLSSDTLPLWLWGILFVGVVPAAVVLHHLVERPAREAMRRHGVPFRRRRAEELLPLANGSLAG